jgi:hypothetical protein
MHADSGIRFVPHPIPALAGVGLRAPHHAAVIAEQPRVGWFEAHSENYFAPGGPAIAALERIRADYPVALHGVGLSLGSADAIDAEHIDRLVRLVDRIDPLFVSEHLCWGAIGGRHTNDLLPMPRTREALALLAPRVHELQERLGRQVLIENVSSYLEFGAAEYGEAEFLAALATESGCALLLDVNNVYVNARNHGLDPHEYFAALPRGAVREIHLAGHATHGSGEHELAIDTHDRPVCDAVWSLYAAALGRFGDVPTLIEWDAQLPSLDTLVAEAAKADALRESRHAHAA